MNEIVNDVKFVAYCGLYCGACHAYLKKKCPGCSNNIKAAWCKIRSCCLDKNYATCADCSSFQDVHDCSKFNNIISIIFAFVFRSNRKACIEQIRSGGIKEHASIMAKKGCQTLKRN